MRHVPLLLAALIAAGPALAENRGVVVANGAYAHAPAVADTDATPAVEAMRGAGYRTVTGTDLVAADLRQAIADLLRPDDSPGARLIVLNGRFLNGGGDSWFMAADAEKPDPVSAPSQGVALSTIMDLVREANPGAVMLLGTDDQAMADVTGLEQGLGPLTPPDGVTVISGTPAATAKAAAALLVAGTSVGDVLAADETLTMAEGGNDALVLVEAAAANAGTATTGAANPAEADRDLWAKAAADDTADSYRNYLSTYPNGLYSAAANDRLAKLGVSTKSDRDLWAEAAATNTAEAYQGYLGHYPQGEFAEAAQRRLTELRLIEDAAKAPPPVAAPAPAPAPQIQTPRRQPAPEIQQPRPQVQEPAPGEIAERNLGLSRNDRIAVQRRLNALGYSTGGTDGVLGSRSRSAIRGWQQQNGLPVTGYLTNNQLALLREQAGSVSSNYEQQDRNYWQQTGARGGANNLRAYLDRYPDGIYAQTARNRLAEINGGGSGSTAGDREDRAWNRARNTDTVQAYTNYLQNWPRGEHAQQARQRRDRLIRQNQSGGNFGLDAESIIRELIR